MWSCEASSPKMRNAVELLVKIEIEKSSSVAGVSENLPVVLSKVIVHVLPCESEAKKRLKRAEKSVGFVLTFRYCHIKIGGVNKSVLRDHQSASFLDLKK